jgi:DNA-binding CsgD family transcriptional regulator
MMDARAPEASPAALDVPAYARSVVTAVLERLCVPFLLLDAEGRVEFASREAEGVIADGRHMTVSAEGLLEVRSPAAAADLSRFLAESGRDILDIDVVMMVSDDAEPIFSTLSTFTPPSPPGGETLPPLTALFIREGRSDEGVAVARARYGLTQAETSVLEAIVAGLTISAHAGRRGVSVHTARKQLNALMGKVGVSRQNQLGGVIDGINRRGVG